MRNYLKLLLKALSNKEIFFAYLCEMGLLNFLDDKAYLKLMYKIHMGKSLNLEHPQTFNEKLQWLKIHDRNPLYTTLVDKYEVKKYVADKIGEQYIIPTLGVWDHFDDIDFDTLPDQFVLKCTHDSGGLVICRDKSKLDKKITKIRIEKCLKRNYYWSGREWPYKNVKPRIIAEKYMCDDMDDELKDYKIMCFDSKVKETFVCSDRFSDKGLRVTFYDTDWKRLPFARHYPVAEEEIEKPKSYDEMKQLAEKLAQKIPFVRVDFYEVKGRPYFGELTFYPGSGMEEFSPEKWDKKLGELIRLPENQGGYLVLSDSYVLWLHEQSDKGNPDESLRDYKFYCFAGKPELLYVSDHLDDHTKAHMIFADMDYHLEPFNRGDYQHFESLPPKPEKFEEMKQIVKTLAKNISFVRVDLYEINHKVYFGELTFHPCAGFMPFEPELWDKKLGKMIRLPKNRGA